MDQQRWLNNMKTEIASCKTFGARSFGLVGGGGTPFNNLGSFNNAYTFHPRPLGREGSIDALLGVRTGPDLI